MCTEAQTDPTNCCTRSSTYNNNKYDIFSPPKTQQRGAVLTRMTAEGMQRQDSCLEDALATVPLLSFRCPLSREAHLRVRLPRRYPEDKLEATVEGTPRLSALSRREIAAAATAAAVGDGEASGLSGERRSEPQCLQVLGEAMRKSDDLAEKESAGRVPSSSLAGVSTIGDGRGAAGAHYGGESGEARRKEGSNVSGTRDQRQQQQQERREQPPRDLGAGPAIKGEEEVGAVLGRRLIYSHHIIAQQKRTGIVKAARELGLGGFSKVSDLVFEWPSDRGPLLAP